MSLDASECPEGMFILNRDKKGGINYGYETKRRAKRKPFVPEPPPWVDGAEWQARFRINIKKATAYPDLGLSPASMDLLRIGVADREAMDSLGVWGSDWKTRPSLCYTFPECNAEGKITNWTFRAADGTKGAGAQKSGCKRGVFIPRQEFKNDGPIYIPEGVTDTAACIDMEMNTIGRPSNSGGAIILAKLLEKYKHRVVVLGENDPRFRKGKFEWPGRDGAEAVANHLSESWKVYVTVAYPPSEYKDMRVWKSQSRTF